ncbi:substrate-binding periplasmic protein [Paucibacter soli]|uniref:substrate-binding periplasmic protein n=1 Tax=Paucibacter soli TaxID=3133433 RepID=UPI0030B6BB68
MRQAVITFGDSRRRPGLCPRRGTALRLAGLVLAGLCSLQAALAAEPKKLTLGTNVDETNFTGLWSRLLYAEAFKRLGMELQIVVAPLKRLEMLLERGEIDGEMIRGPAYGAAHPRLQVVELPLARLSYALYALQAPPGLRSLDDLASGRLRGAYRRGVVFCDEALRPRLAKQQLTAVTTVKQSVDMLAAGHADFICDVSMGIAQYEFETRTQGNKNRLQKLFDISPPQASSSYLLEKHAPFAAQLASTLKQMESEGLVEQYRLEALARLKPP